MFCRLTTLVHGPISAAVKKYDFEEFLVNLVSKGPGEVWIKWGMPNELCWSFSEQCDLFKHSAAKPK